MKNLSLDWFSSGLIDLEHKQYTLLAYLKSVQARFAQSYLYPPLAELVAHYRELRAFQEKRDQLREQLTGDLIGFDTTNWKPIYSVPNVPADPQALAVVDEVVAYSLPRIKATLHEGKALHELVEEELDIVPVGVMPLYKDEGYLLLQPAPKKPHVQVYRYQLSTLVYEGENLKQLQTAFVSTYSCTLAQGPQQIKLSLIAQYPDLPNPATWFATSNLAFPLRPTLMPVIKRKLIQMLHQELR